MKNKKLLIAIVVAISVYIVFAGVVAILFNYISNNPIDKISITYIRDNTDIENEYGEIVSVGKNILYKTIKEESIIKSPYTVTTHTGRVIVYITLAKNGEEWEAVSSEVIEVRPNE